ncbi:flavodoxin family protein BilS [Ruminococcus gauvreauii]|uniref:Flavodoxin family protein n=1 Tax=Ruminococcus gauvreauii TaxID=438033 RepID=A0ABY5VJJ3_9FIRM|nr:flavodoxin family protein BilS [Ruminococcus gauvreauii]UWP60729.1 flavodoxin family protein [Ruminococcus gauvreauii]
MKYSMFYASATGNTKQLAEAAEEVFAQETKVEDPADADLVCVGFWTNEGNAGEEVRKYLKTLHNRKVFLFGTAGFGDSKTYLDGILRNVEDSLNDTNEVVGGFMCQGRMPQELRDRYNKLKEEVPNQGAHYDLMISNFDKALSHPDENDIRGLKAAVQAAAEKLA